MINKWNDHQKLSQSSNQSVSWFSVKTLMPFFFEEHVMFFIDQTTNQ